MKIDSWESFLNAVDDYIQMNEDNSYMFEPKSLEKKKLKNELKAVIKEHRKRVIEKERSKQQELFQ